MLAPTQYDQQKNLYHKELINENVNNPRQFWKNIKEVIPKNGSKITSSVFTLLKIIALVITTKVNRKVKQTYSVRSFLPWLIILKGKRSNFAISHGKKLKSNPLRTTLKFNF